jgi:hypothetical protein
MFPVGALVGVAYALSRVQKKGGPPPVRDLRYLALCWWLAAPLLFVFPGSFTGAWWEPAVWRATIVVLSFPWWFTQNFLSALPFPHAAAALTFFSFLLWDQDRLGGRATARALTLLRMHRREESGERSLAERLRGLRPLRGGGVLAMGLLCARKGDLQGARSLIATVPGMAPKAAPHVARALANEWLAADAAERGDWNAVMEFGSREPRTRLSRFLDTFAIVITAGDPDLKQRLFIRWLVAPRRWHTWPMLKRAWEARTPAPSAAEAVPDGDPLQRAITLHARAVSSEEVGPREVQALGAAWDAALADPATSARLLSRAADLHVPDPGDLRGRLERTAVEDIGSIASASRIDWVEIGDSCDVLRQAGSRVRDEALGAIEADAERLGARVKAKRELPVPDEYREYADLRAAYERAVKLGGMDVRRTLFAHVQHPICNLAVWLFNERKQKPLANGMFRWLLAEAEAVHDEAAIRLQMKNVACAY